MEAHAADGNTDEFALLFGGHAFEPCFGRRKIYSQRDDYLRKIRHAQDTDMTRFHFACKRGGRAGDQRALLRAKVGAVVGDELRARVYQSKRKIGFSASRNAKQQNSFIAYRDAGRMNVGKAFGQ